jgi:hypothetical protein
MLKSTGTVMALSLLVSCKEVPIKIEDTTKPTISFSYRMLGQGTIGDASETEAQRMGGFTVYNCSEDYLIAVTAEDKQSGIKKLKSWKKFVTNCDNVVTYSEPYEKYEETFTIPNSPNVAWVSRLDLRHVYREDLKKESVCVGAKKLKISAVTIQIEATNGVGLTYMREIAINCTQ